MAKVKGLCLFQVCICNITPQPPVQAVWHSGGVSILFGTAEILLRPILPYCFIWSSWCLEEKREIGCIFFNWRQQISIRTDCQATSWIPHLWQPSNKTKWVANECDSSTSNAWTDKGINQVITISKQNNIQRQPLPSPFCHPLVDAAQDVGCWPSRPQKHTAASCPAFHPSGTPGAFLQSCSQKTPLRSVHISGIAPPQPLALGLVQPH